MGPSTAVLWVFVRCMVLRMFNHAAAGFIFSEYIDEEVMKNVDINDLKDNSVRDNLFELLMLSFEKLQPFKTSLRILLNTLKIWTVP